MGVKYNMKAVEQTKFKYMKDFSEGDFVNKNPLRFLKYEEKEGMVAKKTGKKFTAKSFIFEDVETGERIGIQSTGLLNYQMQEYRKGDVINIRYDGKDDEDRHQTTIFENSLVDDDIDPAKVKAVQDAQEATYEEQEADGEDDAEDYV